MEIGQLVQEGEIAATVNGKPMRCTLTGCLRGLLQGGLQVHEGMKCGDIDPRGQQANCFTASDKGHRHRRRRTGGSAPLRMPAGLTFTVDISPHFPV